MTPREVLSMWDINTHDLAHYTLMSILRAYSIQFHPAFNSQPKCEQNRSTYAFDEDTGIHISEEEHRMA